MTTHVLGIDHVSLVVADPERAARFYQGILGLQPLERPELGFPGLWYALGRGQTLHLLAVANPDPVERGVRGGRDRHLALQMADLAGVLARLEHAGVAIERSQSGRPAAFVRDPDGNTIELLGGCG
ncbi:MAG: VOC family protein [Pseudomonadota bacterium]